MWAWSGSRDLSVKFGTSTITFERNYALKIWYTNSLCQALCPRMKNLSQRGHGLGHVNGNPFRNFGALCIFGTVKGRKFEFRKYIGIEHNKC